MYLIFHTRPWALSYTVRFRPWCFCVLTLPQYPDLLPGQLSAFRSYLKEDSFTNAFPDSSNKSQFSLWFYHNFLKLLMKRLTKYIICVNID